MLRKILDDLLVGNDNIILVIVLVIIMVVMEFCRFMFFVFGWVINYIIGMFIYMYGIYIRFFMSRF